MKLNINKIDSANIVVISTISKDNIDKAFDKISLQSSKSIDVSGFRKGKVPISVVKKMHGKKLLEDAKNECLRDIFDESLKDLKVSNSNLAGEPSVSKFDEKDDGTIDIELKIYVKPNISLGNYKELLPEVKNKKVLLKDINDRLDTMALQNAPLETIKTKREVKNKDYVLIDFEGFLNNVSFDGGKANNHSLEIGSGSFITGFEDQVIGMEKGDQKDIKVTFPANYNSKELASKDVIFKVKLNAIQKKSKVILNDDFAKKILPQDKDASLDTLKDKIKEDIKLQKLNEYYSKELKPLYLDTLVKKLDFSVPQSIVEQEINIILNKKASSYSKDELDKFKQNPSEIEKLRKELNPEAINSVKATFIVDALAKSEDINVSDEEVSQVIFYEAMQTGQDPKEALKNYKEKGYLSAIKMSMIEEKVMKKLLDEKQGKK